MKGWAFSINGDVEWNSIYDTKEDAVENFDSYMVSGWSGEWPIVIDIVQVDVLLPGDTHA